MVKSIVASVEELLEPYEVGLRCSICYDFVDTAMMFPSCSHNYCSICIRRSLSFRQKCPTCSIEAHASDLRNNRSLDFLLQNYSKFRDGLFAVLELAQDHLTRQNSELERLRLKSDSKEPTGSLVIKEEGWKKPKKVLRGAAERMSLPSPLGNVSNTLSDFFSRARKREATEVGRTGTSGVKPTTKRPKPNSQTGSVVKVECPVCNIAVVAGFINVHLNSCLS